MPTFAEQEKPRMPSTTITPLYSTAAPNSRIELLANAPVTFSNKSGQASGTCTVAVEFGSNPDVYFDLALASNDPRLFWGDAKGRVSVQLNQGSTVNFGAFRLKTSVNMDARGQTKVRAVAVKPPIILGASKRRAKRVLFHLLNFSAVNGAIDLTLKSKKRRIQLRAVSGASDLIDALDDFGGHAVTRVGEITQSGLDYQTSSRLLDETANFLSFVNGTWATPILPVGFDSQGQRLWEAWALGRAASWRSNTQTLIDRRHVDFLPGLYEGFVHLWEVEHWCRALREVIHWYVHCNSRAAGLEGSIVLGQAALEVLAYTYCVADRGILTEEGVNRLTAADRIRLLLSSLDLPIDVPPAVPNLLRRAKAENWADTPHGLARVRNTIIHPKGSHRPLKFTSSELFEAWNLTLWYVELVLLRLFSHSGPYVNRLDITRWRGTREAFPANTPL